MGIILEGGKMSNDIEICFKKSVVINMEHEYETEEIVSILERVNQIMETQDNVHCLSESIQSYVYAMQEFFKGDYSLEQVKQSYMSEATSAFCVRCEEFLGETNYEYIDVEHEWICRKCIKKEAGIKLSKQYTLEELMFGVEAHSEFAKVGHPPIDEIEPVSKIHGLEKEVK